MTGQSDDGRTLAAFLCLEAVLYGLVIIPGFFGQVCHPLRFFSILVCALYSLFLLKKKQDPNRILLSTALMLTALADFCFEILLDRILMALFIFVLVQLVHGVRLNICFYSRLTPSQSPARAFLGFVSARLVLPVLVLLAAALYSGLLSRTMSLEGLTGRDLLMPALMLVYGCNIIMNQLVSLVSLIRRKSRACLCMSLGFFLFILCDITVAAYLLYPGLGLSLAMTEGMARLTWFFYIPSQILFVMSGIFYDYLDK